MITSDKEAFAKAILSCQKAVNAEGMPKESKLYEEAIKLLNQQAKMRKDSIEMYENGGRQELADKEKAELEVIISFLPKQLTEEEVKDIAMKIKNEIGASSPADMGKLIGAVMKQVTGKADGKLVQGIVKEILS